MALVLDDIWRDLAAWPPAIFVRESAYAYPALETLHVLGLGLLFGSVAAFDCRLLGWHTDLPVRRLARHLLPWVWIGFSINATSGLLLFISDAAEFAENAALQVKLALIALAGLNTLVFHAHVYRSVNAWDVDLPPPASAKLAAAASLAIWVAIIAAGRMIAYVK